MTVVRPQSNNKPAEEAAAAEVKIDTPSRVPRIELRQLRYFLAVAQELNFTRAAQKIGIAQPPLSQQIAALERQLLVTLFNRSKREVTLTEAGRAFVVSARSIINATITAGEVVQAIAKGEEGPLNIGAVFSSIYTLIPLLLPRLMEEFPTIKLNLREMTISQQINSLLENEIDAGILRGPYAHAEFNSLTLSREKFVAVVHHESRLAQEATVALADLARERLIRVRPSANRDYSRRMFSAMLERGHEPNVVQDVSDTHTLLGFVAAGMGASLVPASFQAIQLHQLRYIPLQEDTPITTIQLVWRKDSKATTLRHLVRLSEQLLQESPSGSLNL